MFRMATVTRRWLAGFGFSIGLAALGLVPVAAEDDAAYDVAWRNMEENGAASGGYAADNPKHGFRTLFESDGVRVQPSPPGTSERDVALRLASYGYAGRSRAVQGGRLHANANRAEYLRAKLVEWYLNDPRGLEQRFTLLEPPEEIAPADSRIYLDIAVAGDLLPRLDADEGSVEFAAAGEPFGALRYSGLKVTDARGVELPAHLELLPDSKPGGATLRIVIETRGAAYPIEVDPLLTSASWSTASPGGRRLAWGDWDGDGDLDLAVTGPPANVYENDGGTLVLDVENGFGWTSGFGDITQSLAWGDWDGDGDLDLAVGNDGQPNRVYENEGGTLILNEPAGFGWSSTETDSTFDVAWGDWDGDGNLDLAVGNRGEPNRVYANSVGALSLAWSSDESDTTVDVAWGDWDGDGDLDLAVGNNNLESDRVYENDENDGGTLKVGDDFGWSSDETDDSRNVAWGDWNGDGNLDLAVAVEYSLPGGDPIIRVYENSGGALSLAWDESWSTPDGAPSGVAWGDWDGDGDLDLAVGLWSGPNRVYGNSGGALSLAWSSDEADQTYDVAWGDWDGDGDLELAAGGIGSIRVYRNTGNLLLPTTSFDGSRGTWSTAWGDWDGDGDLDLAVGNAGNDPNRVYDNDAGSLVPTTAFGTGQKTRSVAWGDWNGDGYLDLAVGNARPTASRVYQNTGGALSPAQTLGVSWARSVAWGDWDGDGDLDLAVGNHQGEQNQVYENDGGTLILDVPLGFGWVSAEADDTDEVAWADWDGDGDLDLAVGNTGQPNRVYENDGGTLILDMPGGFGWSSVETDVTRSVAWGDWDGDGDVDLAVGNDGQPNRVYENEGGTLILNEPAGFGWSSIETDATRDVAWSDWDGDGDLDLGVGNVDQATRLYVNDGGTLVLGWTSAETGPTRSVSWGDLDLDGDPDLVVANDQQPNRIYENGSVNVSAGLPETPVRAVAAVRPGATKSAFFFSTPEMLLSPVDIDYTLFDEQSDRAWEIVPEYSLNGGGQWLPATPGASGDGTIELAASPLGTAHTFQWDVDADGVCTNNALFRIIVQWQAPDHVGEPLQRGALSATTPPFRVHATPQIWYRDADGDGLGDPDVTLASCWQPAEYTPAGDDCDDANANCTTDCTDADSDGYCVTTDCDDAKPNCALECTDGDVDGWCLDTDCDDASPDCNQDCSDVDVDGLRACEGDCNDANANCTTDCTDADSDGYCVTTDCDDAKPNCALECTDGDVDGWCLDTDCDDASPDCNQDCSDVDVDGLRACEGDCNDANANCTTDCTDADSDGYCVTTDCNDAKPNCALECTDGDVDGWCLDTDCDDASPDCNQDCSDVDVDGLRACEGDCNDANANCTTDCTDSDSDGYCVTTDCDDGKPNCTTDCTDVDGDSFCVTTDCADTNDQVWAVPVGVDLTVTKNGGPSTDPYVDLAWTSQTLLSGPETTYDIVTGLISDLMSDDDFSRTTDEQCDHGDVPFASTASAPVPGDGSYWLVRAENSCGGDYGPGQARQGLVDGAVSAPDPDPCP